jgi:hypothetical protein
VLVPARLPRRGEQGNEGLSVPGRGCKFAYMAAELPPDLLRALAGANEITIRTAGTATEGLPIWSVVAAGAAFIRSVRGARGKWYRGALAEGWVEIRSGRRWVRLAARPVDDEPTQAAVDAAFREKYSRSPYLGSIVAELARTTTLRLDAVG